MGEDLGPGPGCVAAGFTVAHIFGGWLREPVGAGDGELLVIAHT